MKTNTGSVVVVVVVVVVVGKGEGELDGTNWEIVGKGRRGRVA